MPSVELVPSSFGSSTLGESSVSSFDFGTIFNDFAPETGGVISEAATKAGEFAVKVTLVQRDAKYGFGVTDFDPTLLNPNEIPVERKLGEFAVAVTAPATDTLAKLFHQAHSYDIDNSLVPFASKQEDEEDERTGLAKKKKKTEEKRRQGLFALAA